MVLDTLIYTITLLLIPINLAASTGKYDLMNIYILLLATSWATHSIWHTSNDPKPTIYCTLDTIMCYVTIAYTFMYAQLYVSSRRSYIYDFCLGLVIFSYLHIKDNKNYHKRGLENWHHHMYHILMHLSAVTGLSVIAY